MFSRAQFPKATVAPCWTTYNVHTREKLWRCADCCRNVSYKETLAPMPTTTLVSGAPNATLLACA